jgi:hypothetical protein
VTTDPNVARNRQLEGEIQYFRPNEIERIEIEGRSLDDARYETRTVEVGLDSNWIDTNIDVRRGERVQVTASGVISIGRSRVTPDGLSRTDPTAPLPSAKEGKLIGAISDDPRAPIIELGSSREFTADRDGRLYLTVNRGSFADARGTFSVQLRRERDLSAIDTATATTRPAGRRRTRPPGVPGPGAGPVEQTITVPGNSRATDTGLDVRAGDQITFSASGMVVAGQRAGEVGPEGRRSSGLGSIISARPVPTAGVGALVGYIRTPEGQAGQAFFIGTQLVYTVPSDGRLFLLINDDNYNDNSGNFTVRVKVNP